MTNILSFDLTRISIRDFDISSSILKIISWNCGFQIKSFWGSFWPKDVIFLLNGFTKYVPDFIWRMISRNICVNLTKISLFKKVQHFHILLCSTAPSIICFSNQLIFQNKNNNKREKISRKSGIHPKESWRWQFPRISWVHVKFVPRNRPFISAQNVKLSHVP